MTGYISIRQIMDDLMDHPMLQDLTLERVVKYAVDFMRLIGIPNLYEDRVQTIHIDRHRAILPCDLIQLIQVRDKNTGYCYTTTTDSFFGSDNENQIKAGFTYKHQGNVLITSKEYGDIDVAYRAMLTDEEGFPVLPDNGTFAEALELYIKKKCFTTLVECKKMDAGILEIVDRDYLWKVAQATQDLRRPTIDQMQSIMNMWNTMIQRKVGHEDGFKHLNQKEIYIKR